MPDFFLFIIDISPTTTTIIIIAAVVVVVAVLITTAIVILVIVICLRHKRGKFSKLFFSCQCTFCT